MPDLAPQLIRIDTPEGACVQLRGRWGAAEMGERAQWRALKRQLAAAAPSASLGWDLRGLQWLDHIGAQLLWNHWGHVWPALSPAPAARCKRCAPCPLLSRKTAWTVLIDAQSAQPVGFVAVDSF